MISCATNAASSISETADFSTFSAPQSLESKRMRRELICTAAILRGLKKLVDKRAMFKSQVHKQLSKKAAYRGAFQCILTCPTLKETG